MSTRKRDPFPKSRITRGPAVRFAPLPDATTESKLQSLAQQRAAIANFCKSVAEQIHGPAEAGTLANSAISPVVKEKLAELAPRVLQTLQRMLAGDSEKEIGIHMGVSKHTVHIYVKTLYRHFEVNSRGELLARFVNGAFRSVPTA